MLPTRVIDVGSSDDISPIKLARTKGDYGTNVAFSYCWGSSKTLTTTISTLEDRLKEIDLRLLPGAFVDAVAFCQRLGIKYLWIDALCIIQDNETDWATEASKMAMVYSLSTLTISTTGAPEVSCGFLHGPEIGPQPSITWRDPSNQRNGRLHLRSKTDGWDGLMKSTPLTNPGLSPRVLHFGTQMFWECWGYCWSKDEQFNHKVNQPNDRKKKGLPPLYRWQRQSLEPAKGGVPMFEFWSRIVQDYTSRRLTNPRDKLPALAGLAKNAQQRSGDKYYAGLWLSCLPLDLLWCRERYCYLERSSLYRAPSWSWAAVDGQIKRWEPNYPFTTKEVVINGHHEVEIDEIFARYYPEGSLEEC